MNTNMRVGVVVIGRNESPRLRRCIDSVLKQTAAGSVVYVDSGSTDGSPELARTLGISVIELDSSKPFSAARARNAGFERLMNTRWRGEETEAVQFVDGDCELCAGWIAQAQEALSAEGRTAAVCGILRERDPDGSLYNRLCEMEWAGALGDVASVGGVAMFRAEALRDVGSFKTTMIAGEEPELCARLRKAGWCIRRIDAGMATHDADMQRFSQWWRRTSRAGHAWAELAVVHGRAGSGESIRQVASSLVWGLILPVFAIGFAWPTSGWSLLALVAYPIQWARIRRAHVLRGFASRDSGMGAFFILLGKVAQCAGLLRFALNRARRRPTPVIEYKTPPSATAAASAGPQWRERSC